MKNLYLVTLFLIVSHALAAEEIRFKPGITISEQAETYVVSMTGDGKIPEIEFRPLWNHFPYPIRSYTFSINKADCLSIYECMSSDYVSIDELHITGHSIYRKAKVNYTLHSFGDTMELNFSFVGANGKSISHTFTFKAEDVEN